MARANASEGRFLLVFGSETGQAKAIAEIIRDKAIERGLRPDTFCFSQYDKQVGTTIDYGTTTCNHLKLQINFY